MDFKLAKLTLKNFKGSTNLEVRFDGKVNFLIGINGSGKTMIGNAIQYLFEGKTFFNKKYRRKIITDGEDKMKVVGEFFNSESGKTLVITQSLTAKDNPNLKIESGNEKTLGMNDVMDMINMLYLRPFDIINKTPQEQAKLLGVDTSKYDKNIEDKKEKLKLPRAELKKDKDKFKEYLTKPEKIDKPKPISELYTERDNINTFNNNQNILAKNILNQEHMIAIAMDRIHNLNISIFTMETNLIGFDKPKEEKPTKDILQKIVSADDIKKKYDKYTKYTTLQSDIAIKETAFATKEGEVTKAEEEKIAYVKQSNVPSSVSFDDEGGLLITAFNQEEVYLKEEFFSKGQILKMAIQFCLIKIVKDKQKGKDTIPILFIDNAESLDESKLDYIHDISEKHKLQFILAYQNDKPLDGKTCILLEEKAIKGYKEE